MSSSLRSPGFPTATLRRASPHTIASYRDTFRLLLQFACKRLRKEPWALAEVDAPLIAAFRDDLEKSHSNTARSHNLRLTAMGSFFRYAACEEPTARCAGNRECTRACTALGARRVQIRSRMEVLCRHCLAGRCCPHS